jgi:hypothetical protein
VPAHLRPDRRRLRNQDHRRLPLRGRGRRGPGRSRPDLAAAARTAARKAFAILTAEQKDAGPGEEVDRREAESEPGGAEREVAGWDGRSRWPRACGTRSFSPTPGMTRHPFTISADIELGTRTDTLHVESAFHLVGRTARESPRLGIGGRCEAFQERAQQALFVLVHTVEESRGRLLALSIAHRPGARTRRPSSTPPGHWPSDPAASPGPRGTCGPSCGPAVSPGRSPTS